MLSAEDIAAMDIAQIKLTFYTIMDDVVTTYQDNQDQGADPEWQEERDEQA